MVYVVQSHSVYYNSYIINPYAARMICRASAPDAPTQFFQLVVKHYYIAGRPLTGEIVLQSHSVYYNKYIISSYAARMICRASVPDAPTQFFQLVVQHYYIAGRPLTGDQLETKQYISISCNLIAT